MNVLQTVVDAAEQNDPTVAQSSPTFLSLRLRLVLMVAIVVTTVIGIEAYLQSRLFEISLERQLLDNARLTALAVADDIEVRREPLDADDLTRSLHEFGEASPPLRSISLLQVVNGEMRLWASTLSDARPAIIDAGRAALEQGGAVWADGEGSLRGLAVPVFRAGQPFGAVVVTISLYAVEQARAQGRRVTLWFAVTATFILTVLVDLLARRLIHRPIAAIHETMTQAGSGDLSARAPVVRPDEIGAIAGGLNVMLGQMQRFNQALQGRVDDATAELRNRNAELVGNHQRILTLREALSRAQQMAAVGQMAANTAHQLGTPLNLISGYVQLMIDELREDPRSLSRLRIIEDQIGKVATTMKAMLASARRTLALESSDPAELVQRVAELARPSLAAAGIRLVLHVGGPIPRIMADPVQLELALLNFIANSVDAMPHGGQLTLRLVASAHGQVQIEIADTGCGIALDLLPRVFEPWVTTKPAGRGTGLGLSISRDVITAHGGGIAVRSGPDEGTTFVIELPAQTGALAVTGAARPQRGSGDGAASA